MEEQITIYLTTPEAVLFRDFQAFHTMFTLLVQKGVFDTKNGSVTLHFDSEGTIQNIQRNDYLYSRKHEVIL